MIARPSSSYRPRQHSTTSLPNSNLVQSTSRPGTPPRSRGESHLHKSSSKSRHIPLQVMSDRPIIPKSKKPDGRRRDGASPSAQRSRIRQDAAALTMEQEQIDDDEEMLYDLLGVTSPLPPRVQPSSKDNSLPVSTFPLDISRPRIRNRIGKYAADSEPERRGKGTRGRRDVSRREAESDSRAPVAQARSAKLRVNRDPGEHGIMSEGDAIHHSRSQRQKALSRDPSSDGHVSPSAQTIPNPLSGINATRTKMRRHSPVSAGTPPIDSESVFDLSPLIQSLPDAGPLPLIPQPVAGSRSARKFPKSGDESAVWDMPDTISSLNKQELTVRSRIPNELTDISQVAAEAPRFLVPISPTQPQIYAI